uniref:Uncharacterized protein n=1 Tax=Aegilops tauschii subsp. strangulata TaxID=200361 RepID=A0A453BTW2_AEGTS
HHRIAATESTSASSRSGRLEQITDQCHWPKPQMGKNHWGEHTHSRSVPSRPSNLPRNGRGLAPAPAALASPHSTLHHSPSHSRITPAAAAAPPPLFLPWPNFAGNATPPGETLLPHLASPLPKPSPLLLLRW